MALDSSFVGRSYPAAGTYQVCREKIREFAAAVGDQSPLCWDTCAAHTAGHPDVLAPPTFGIILSLRAQQRLITDPQLGLDYSRVVHGEQSFTHHRPIRAGDELCATLHVDGIRTVRGNEMLTVRCEIADVAGQPVTTARSILVVRAAEPPAGQSPGQQSGQDAGQEDR